MDSRNKREDDGGVEILGTEPEDDNIKKEPEDDRKKPKNDDNMCLRKKNV